MRRRCHQCRGPLEQDPDTSRDQGFAVWICPACVDEAAGVEPDDEGITWGAAGPIEWFGMELPTGEYVPFDNATISGTPTLTMTWNNLIMWFDDDGGYIEVNDEILDPDEWDLVTKAETIARAFIGLPPMERTP